MSSHNDYQVITSPQADLDLENIFMQGLITRGEELAEKYIDRLIDAIDSLGKFPGRGRNRNELFPGCKTWHEGVHVIVYHIDGSTVFVDRILHDRMDIPSQFR